MGNIRSREKLKESYDWDKANNLFLRFSFHDKLRAEIVHTKDTEAIVSDVLGKEFPKVTEDTFQIEVLNHVYGEVLAGPIS